jgi:hypothetical protein
MASAIAAHIPRCRATWLPCLVSTVQAAYDEPDPALQRLLQAGVVEGLKYACTAVESSSVVASAPPPGNAAHIAVSVILRHGALPCQTACPRASLAGSLPVWS